MLTSERASLDYTLVASFVLLYTQVQRTMRSIKALEVSVDGPEEVQPATKKAAQKLTNFRVSCKKRDALFSSGLSPRK